MRNTLAHPITTPEILDYLETLASFSEKIAAREQKCGDMRPLLMRAAIGMIKQQEATTKFLMQTAQAMRSSTDDVPSHFITAIEDAIPRRDSHGMPE